MSENGTKFQASSPDIAVLKVAFAIWIEQNASQEQKNAYLSTLKNGTFPGLSQFGGELESMFSELKGMK